MIRAKLATIVAVLLLTDAGILAATQDEKVPAETREQLVKLYDAVAENMKRCSPLFAAKATNGVVGLEVEVRKGHFPREPKAFEIWGDLHVQVRMDSMHVIHVVNRILSEQLYEKKKMQHVSTLTRDAAIERAREYLKEFKWEVPPDFKVGDVKYNKHRGSWVIRWHRFTAQYDWDEFASESPESMVVEFQETDGLVFIVCHSCFPPPKSLEVKVTKEQAIAKAWKYVEIAQHLAMVSGYVATKLKSCELRVAAPQCRLDSKGTGLVEECTVPRETRLCWVVTIYIKDSKKEEHAFKDDKGNRFYLCLPGIPVIYVDAATGAVLGFELDCSGE
jgi:hypothetical protein